LFSAAPYPRGFFYFITSVCRLIHGPSKISLGAALGHRDAESMTVYLRPATDDFINDAPEPN
jgi:hypothetical protein